MQTSVMRKARDARRTARRRARAKRDSRDDRGKHEYQTAGKAMLKDEVVALRPDGQRMKTMITGVKPTKPGSDLFVRPIIGIR